MLTVKNRWRRALAATALTTAGILGLSSCSLVPTSWKTAVGAYDTYTAYFDSAAGLYEGNDVAVLGMPVGRITSLNPEGTRVRVELAVDSGITIPAEATAAIVNTSIVTTRHIELTPVYTGGEKLAAGGTLAHTASPVEIGTLFDAINDLVANLQGEDGGEQPIADLVDIASGVADGNGERLRQALTALEKAGRLGASNADGLGEVIKNIAVLTDALTANYPKMAAFSKSVTQVSEMLGDQSVGLQSTLANVNQTLENTAAFLEGNAGTLSSSMTNLAALAANLSDYSRQLVDTIDMGPLLFQNLANSISAEQGAWRAQVMLDKSLIDNELLARFCEAVNLQKNGCRTGQLADFGPDLGVFSALLELSKR
ncbi:Mce family protein [Gordonia hirsuta DSM 44140 = NBRC 16056]|uniref:Mce family protein n=1 Tax=Gordonia hirsuta DSM 44140 = NBRC 16056 TaxID=1121927 RepID=L7L572_9ACTN|nr:MCE family protein [Gordonia hirsuta]GAC55906.1 Mce family protein [Gordonia hirsuta DSM 44140 = NBRC 16056]